MSDLRVAMIIQAYLPHVGGAERQLAALAPLLQVQGVDVHVITRRFRGLSAYEMMNGVPVHRIPVPGPKPLAALSFTAASLPLLHRLKPDVIHAHELLSPLTTAVAAKILFRVPVVAKVLRGGTLGDMEKISRSSLGRLRINWYKRNVNSFITISQEIDQELQQAGVNVEKRFHVPNGVDTRKFMPVSQLQKLGLRRVLSLPDGPVVVYSGRLAPEKNVDQLLNIWPVIKRLHKNATLLILGEGEKEADLKRRSSDGVRFEGRVENVVLYLQASDLFVLPSSTEGLSNAMLEAMACGLPVIATHVGGAPDLIRHGHSGWLIPAGNQRYLREGLLTLLADPDRCRFMGYEARKWIVKHYSLSAVAHQLVELYHNVAHRPALLPSAPVGA